MTDAFLSDAYEAFLEEPTADNYRRVRRIVLAQSRGVRDPLGLVAISELCEEGRFVEAREQLQRTWSSWCLSPRFHWLAGYASSRLGDDEDVELCRFQFETCLDALLTTGNGSEMSPYDVVQPADEYDVIRALGLHARNQRMIQRDGRCLDVVACDGGMDVWFDLGVMHHRMIARRQFTGWLDRTSSQALHQF